MDKFKKTLVITPYLLGQGSTFNALAKYWEKKWQAQLLGDYFYSPCKAEYFSYPKRKNSSLRLKHSFSEKSSYRAYVEERNKIQSVYVYAPNTKNHGEEISYRLNLLKKHRDEPVLMRIRPTDFTGEVRDFLEKNFTIVFAFSTENIESSLVEYALMHSIKTKEFSRQNHSLEKKKKIRLNEKYFEQFYVNIQTYYKLYEELKDNTYVSTANINTLPDFFSSLNISDWQQYYTNYDLKNAFPSPLHLSKIKSNFMNPSKIEYWSEKIISSVSNWA